MSELRGLDEWITGGRYRKEYLMMTCSKCQECTIVECETEYGASYCNPQECKYCFEPFDEKTVWETYDPREELEYEYD